MSADSLNAAAPPSTTTATESRSTAGAVGPKHRAHKGPAVGFEALLEALTAAQDQTAAADAAGKSALPGVGAPAKDASLKDGAGQDAAADADKDAAATTADTIVAVQDPATVPPVIIPVAPVAPQAPVVAAPTTVPVKEGDTAKPEPVLAANTPPPPVQTGAAPTALADDAGPAEPETEHEPRAYGLSKLESGQTIPAAAAAERRIDRAEARAALSHPTTLPAATASNPSPKSAPAQPAANEPAGPLTTTPATEAAPVLAEAAQAAAPPPAKDASKEAKGPSRYARNEVERSASAKSATAGPATAGSAISARMGDVAQSASDAQLQALALGPNSGGGDEDLSPAIITQTAETPAGAAPSADLNAATASTTAPATVTQAAVHLVRGQPQTVANLAAQIVKKLDGRSTRFDVALDPVGLGHVDVRVEIGAQGRMTAALAFDTPQAAAELRARASELSQALEQAGFDVSGGLSFDVATDSGQSQGSAGQNDQQTPVFRGRAFQTALDTVVDPLPARAFQYRRSSASGVDIRI